MKRAAAASFLLATFVLSSFGSISLRLSSSQPVRSVEAHIYIVGGVSFEEAMAIPEFRQLPTRAGIGLMTTKAGNENSPRASYLTVLNGRVTSATDARVPLLLRELRANRVSICQSATLGEAANACARLAEASRGTVAITDLRTGFAASALPAIAADAKARLVSATNPAIVIIVSPSPSRAMDEIGDEVTPIIVAPDIDLGGVNEGQLLSVHSRTTRQGGLVANVDVAPTVLEFVSGDVSQEMDGQPIGLSRTPPPLDLHRLHLEPRRIRLPIQLGQIAFISILALVGVPALFYLRRRGALSPRVAAALQFLVLCGLALPVTVLAGGLLPRLTYGVVVPYLVVTTVALAGLSLSARTRGPIGPVVFLGAVSLGFVLLDGALGGRAFRIPLMGGTMFDGVRFYGLPNAFIAIPLAGALFVATTLRPYTGFLLLIGVALFAGFPSLGANLGAAATVFVAAGLWWVLTTRRRFGLRELSFVAGVVALGLGIVLLVNQYLADAPTHVGRFAERTGGLGEVLSALWRRLGIGVGMLNDVPIAYVPVLGLLLVAWLARRGPTPIGEGLRMAGEPWRHAIVALSLSSFLAFFAEDTGVAAAAPGFLFALAPLAYAAFGANSTSKAARDIEKVRDE